MIPGNIYICIYVAMWDCIRGGERGREGEGGERDQISVCVFYCRTYYKAVRVGGGVCLISVSWFKHVDLVQLYSFGGVQFCCC
jgi:hypothetical protein